MKVFRLRLLVGALLVFVFILFMGCSTRLARDFEKQLDSTKKGILDTRTNIETNLTEACADTPKVTEKANEILRLVSSEERTLFIVDGKEMGRAKHLKVCIDSEGDHTVIAEPPGCEAKIEKLKPPYNFPMLRFQFMMAECKAANNHSQ